MTLFHSKISIRLQTTRPAKCHQPSNANYIANQNARLCDTHCRKFIRPFITSSAPLHVPLFKAVPYGTVNHLKDRSTATKCPICTLLVELVARHLDNQLPSSSTRDQHVWLRSLVDSGGYLFDVYLNGCELGAVRYAKKCILKGALKSAPFGDLLDTAPVAPSLIKSWLHTCQSTHGEMCRSDLHISKLRYQSSRKLILIDTLEEKLVLDQPSLETRYIALSYVLGGVNSLRTTSQDLARLEEVGALSARNAELPRTVRDAMAVVSLLDERYLWVDTLCIIQDDEASKADFISQMDIVYHHAFLTIVAMSGHDANAGLPGLDQSNRPNQLYAHLSNDDAFFTTSPGLRSSATTSRYETRGWTLQERMLSKRCLYFSAREVYYQCRCTIYQGLPSIRKLLGATPLFEPPSLMNPLKISSVGSLLNAEDAYQPLVENYSRRDLTFSWDKLNAFRGLLGLFGNKGDGETWGKTGVPASFWASLLWAPVTTLTRRAGGGSPDGDAPGWSWLAWDGPINFPLLGKGTPSYKTSTSTLCSLRIPFDSLVRASTFPITNGQIRDVNNEAVPGTLLRDTDDSFIGVIYDFEEKLSAAWDSAWLVFHSTIKEDYETGLYDSGYRPRLRFTVGNYVHVLDEFSIETRMVNVLVVGGKDRMRPRQRLAMGQVFERFWETLTPEKGLTIYLA